MRPLLTNGAQISDITQVINEEIEAEWEEWINLDIIEQRKIDD